VRRRWWLGLVVLVLIGLAGLATAKVVQWTRYGDVHPEGGSAVVVDHGHRFSLAVPDRGPSVGDHWTAAATPDGVVTLVRNEQVDGNIAAWVLGPAIGGGAGTRYFVFDARRAGSVTITLHNCFQGCRTDRTTAESRDVVWTVTVR
jgi:inhibitor of cysteine peptidase